MQATHQHTNITQLAQSFFKMTEEEQRAFMMVANLTTATVEEPVARKKTKAKPFGFTKDDIKKKILANHAKKFEQTRE